MLSYPILFSLVTVLAASAQAKKIKLTYDGGAKNILHHLVQWSDVVDIPISDVGLLPDDENWNFILKADGERPEVKCHVEGVWSTSSLDDIEFHLDSSTTSWVKPCDYNQGFKIICDPGLTVCERGPALPSVAAIPA